MEVAMKTKQKSYELMAWQYFEVDISSVVTVQKQTKVTRQNVGCEPHNRGNNLSGKFHVQDS